MPALGIIGCGTVGTHYYLPVLRSHFHYTDIFVYDPDTERCRKAAAKFAARAVSLDMLLRQCQHIIIASPPHTHYELLQQSITNGKTILCEKPFLLSETEVRQVTAMASEKQCKVFAAHIRRLFPHVALAKQLVGEGRIGPVKAIYMHEGTRFNYAAASGYLTENNMGGVLPDTGSHALDMLLHISGLNGDQCEIISLQRDKPEPAHEVQMQLIIQQTIPAFVHLSRYRQLANKLTLTGELATLDVPAGIRPFVRLQYPDGKIETIHVQQSAVNDMFDAFRLELETVFIKQDENLLGAQQFISLTTLLQKLHLHTP